MSVSTTNNLMDLYKGGKYEIEDMENEIIGDLSLRTIIDTNTLQQIQNKLAELTGISMVTVDYKGTPITEETSFSEFCKLRREVTSCKKNCFFSDAYGGLKAAMDNEPYIYCCPAGLVDCAVPIVINGQHLGAVLMGQVRVNDVDNLEKLGDFIKEEMNMQENQELYDKYMETPLLDIERIEMVASLTHFLVNEMIEKQIILRVEREIKKENRRLQSESVIKDNIISEYKRVQIKNTEIGLAPQFLLSVMESINNLSIIESANKTNQMVNLFTQILHFNNNANSKFVSMEKEIENAKNYLQIKRMQLGENLSFTINVNCDIVNKKIPPLVLFPFIDNAVVHGIQNESTIEVSININEQDENIFISIKDNGVGIEKTMLGKLYDKQLDQGNANNEYSGLTINNTRRRMIQMFGDEYDITINSAPKKGTRVTISLPKDIKEDKYT